MVRRLTQRKFRYSELLLHHARRALSTATPAITVHTPANWIRVRRSWNSTYAASPAKAANWEERTAAIAIPWREPAVKEKKPRTSHTPDATTSGKTRRVRC